MKKLYLLLGQETAEKNIFLENLKKSELKDLFQELQKITIEEDKGLSLLKVLQNPSLFSQSRLIIVSRSEKISIQYISKIFIQYKKSQDFLILCSDENKLTQWEKTKEVLIIKKVFYPLSEIDKKKFIFKLAQQHHCKITNEGAEYFVLMSGTDTATLKSLGNLVFSSIDKDTIIDESVLSSYLTHSRIETTYTLFYAILESNFSLALDRLNRLIQSKIESLTIISLLIWQTRRLLKLSYEKGREELFYELKIFRNEKQLYERGLQSYTSLQIENILKNLINYDIVLREEKKENHSHLLQICLYEIICKKGSPCLKIKNDLPILLP